MLTLDGATLNYDENGNLETRTDACGTTNYTWDGRNRLTGISGYKADCSPLSASFNYDTLNRRTERTVNGVTTEYVYDGWDILQETTNGVTTDYTRTLNIDEPLALERSDGTIRYYKADALGSIVALTDENGAVTTSYAYDAYGAVTVSGSDVNAFQYTGRENDGTGLYYYRARYYSPEMRRFVSEDPIGLVGGLNFYGYVRDNPINWSDPKGLVAPIIPVIPEQGCPPHSNCIDPGQQSPRGDIRPRPIFPTPGAPRGQFPYLPSPKPRKGQKAQPNNMPPKPSDSGCGGGPLPPFGPTITTYP
jgi:RHS repeat-associated protein